MELKQIPGYAGLNTGLNPNAGTKVHFTMDLTHQTPELQLSFIEAGLSHFM